MNRRIAGVVLAVAVLLGLGGCKSRYDKYQADFIGLFDTATVIVGYADSQSEFDRYANIIHDRLEELHRLYDIYNAYDGINNLYTVNENAGIAPVEVSRDVIDMLLTAREGYDASNGILNIAMGPVLRIWHDYRTAGIANEEAAELPPMDVLREAVALTDINDVIINETKNTVFLTKPGMSLDVGAIAKGYAAEQAAQAARDAGATSILMNVGGNITAIGKPLDNVRARWGVGVQDPDLGVNGTQNILDTVYFCDKTMSCSGDYQRYYVVDGQSYNHIIDPATLMPASLYKQVAVIHEDAGIADIISTTLFILPQEEGAAFAKKMNAEALWMYQDGSRKATDGYVRISKTLGNYTAVD